MSREVRITIDDDEVFERMKQRKRDLDLSWEDVLHRGLRPDPGSSTGPTGRGPGPADTHGPAGHAGRPGPTPGSGSGGPGFGRSSEPGHHDPGDADWRQRGHGRDPGVAYDDQWDRFAEGVEAQVQNKVYNALRSTFGAAGIEVPEPPTSDLDREMRDLSSAEDAVLSFDFLDDDPAYQVPLRVTLQTSTDGLDVEVVAVRQGKSVSHMNRFDADARLAVTERLAAGEPAVLRFDDGAEGYAVEPIIRWERDESGRPTVTRVDVEAVRLSGTDDE